MRRDSPLIKLAAFGLGLALVLGLLGLAEGVARLCLQPGVLDRILAMLERDPQLFWRNRADRDTAFFGDTVVTNASGLRRPSVEARPLPQPPPGTARVLCLGESPTFGWGVSYQEAYPAVLEALLRAEGRAVEVVNAGMIGYSTHQGRSLLERELLAWRPDVITVPFVINDVDKYRFHRTTGTPDRTLEPEPAWRVALLNLLDRSALLRALGAVVARASGQRDQVSGRPVELFRPREVRVPPPDYRRNLEAIVRAGAARGARVVFIVMPLNLPPGPAVAEADQARVRELVQRAERELDAGAAEVALATLNQALALDPQAGEAHYFVGLCQRRLGDPQAAARAFDAAMEAEARRCGREGLEYNRIMREVARELGVPLVDVTAAFDARGRDGLFLTPRGDPIHPTREGHALIGRLVFEQVRGLLPPGSGARR